MNILDLKFWIGMGYFQNFCTFGEVQYFPKYFEKYWTSTKIYFENIELLQKFKFQIMDILKFESYMFKILRPKYQKTCKKSINTQYFFAESSKTSHVHCSFFK